MSTIPFDGKQFVCALCQDYLSRAPIYLLQDNRDVCSNCLFGDQERAFRNMSLENVLVNAYFPCKNASEGCTMTYKFGEEDAHSSTCTFRPIRCPLCKKSESECGWNGRFGELREHIRETHNQLTSKNAEFLINVNVDAVDSFVVLNGECCFIVNYGYVSSVGVLKYTVALLHFAEQNFQVMLRNHSEPDGRKLLKEYKAVCYSGDLSQRIPQEIINVQELISFLNNATSILLTLTAEPTAEQDLGDSTNLVKSNIVNFFKCGLCRENLRLPIFEDANKAFICSYCYYDSKEQFKYNMLPLDNELSCLLAKENDSCKQEHCDKIVRGSAIVNHERSCPFRIYTCFICHKKLLYSIAKDHYETMHSNASYFEQEYEFVMKAKTSTSCYTLFQHELIDILFTFDSYFQIKVMQSGVIPNYQVIIELQCTNKQLNAPSLKYVFNGTAAQPVRIESPDLLACFHTEIGVRIYFDYCK